MSNWATTTRVVRGCPHACGHTHGTVGAYTQDRCRCEPCTQAAREYARARRRAQAYGQPYMVDATTTLEHLRRLRQLGMTIDHISTVSGVTHSGLTDLLDRPTGKIHATTRDVILGVSLFAPTEHHSLAAGRVRSLGSLRRIHALGAIGWSQTQIADHAGLTVDTLVKLASPGKRTVQLDTARRIAATYNELWNTPPPADTPADRRRITRVLAQARRRGWPPPMAWDDDRIDNPRHKPSGFTAAA